MNYRAYKTELDLNNKEVTLLKKYSGMRRLAWNWGLGMIKSGKVPPNAMKLNLAWNIWKKENIPFWVEYSKAVAQSAFQDLERAFQAFFRGCKGKGPKVGYPRFRSKKTSKKSFRLIGTIHIKMNRIQVPRIGELRLKEKGYLPVDAKVLSVTISERAGKWFVSAVCEHNQQSEKCVNGEVLGIDLGIKTLAVLSNGKKFENSKAYRKLEKQLARSQRRFSRQKKESNRREQTRQKISKIHYRISCIRSDSIHKATTEIAKTKQLSLVVLEDLNVNGMVKNHKLAKSIQDASFFEFRRQLEYKSKWNGFDIIVADRFFPSSKKCSSCGVIKEDLSLSERTYDCPSCNLNIDRDLNAAINLRNWCINKFTVSSTGCAHGEIISPEIINDSRLSRRSVNQTLNLN